MSLSDVLQMIDCEIAADHIYLGISGAYWSNILNQYCPLLFWQTAGAEDEPYHLHILLGM